MSVARRGAEQAGAIFLIVDRKDGRSDLYGPAPQSVFDADGPADRRFSVLAKGLPGADIAARMEQELRFDPDLWLIDIEDREGRCFVDLIADSD